ncbi:MAG: hypothetical protein KF764_10350 [Labilithrix sp.]|nr:hypothetical protein [Labilithrix sp.]
MSDSLLDQALRYCHASLLEMRDTPARRHLAARLGVLERAAWAIPLVPATAEQVVSIVKLVLDLRDDVVRAQADVELFAPPRSVAPARQSGDATACAIASAVASRSAPAIRAFHASTIAGAGGKSV